jgi:hypothetical protein
MRLSIRVALAASGALLGCSAFAQEKPSSAYRDVTATHMPQEPELHALDALVIDVDKDGDNDVVLAVEHDENRLYLNDGQGHLSWKKGALGSHRYDSEHVRSADFDRDGFPDLVFVAEDDRHHQLFFGRPGGAFVDASDRLLAQSQGNAVAVGDVNGDSLPDILVGNSAEPRPGQERGSGQDFLWLNDPARPGHFIDASRSHLPQVDDDTQDIVLVDIDGDGDLDMVVANESPPNRLLLNDGKGRFIDASGRLELKVPMETREAHVFDATGDGRPDILFLNLTSNNHGWDKDPQARLLVGQADGRFLDETTTRLPANRFSSWGGAIVDFDRDGDPDILASAIQVPGFVPEQVRAYRNDGKGRFEDATLDVVPGLTVGRSWSMGVGDLDGDGRVDIVIGQWGTQARLLLTGGVEP